MDTNVTPTKEDQKIAELILKKDGNISAVARSLKKPRKTIYAHINNSEYLQDTLADAREVRLDDAEDQLGQAVKKGEAWAVCFTLKTQGQGRGYVEKQKLEHTGKDGGPIQQKFIVEIVDGANSTSDKNPNE